MCLVLVLCRRAHGVPTNSFLLISYLTVKDQCNLEERRINLNKMHELTMLLFVALIDTINAMEPMVYMVR